MIRSDAWDGKTGTHALTLKVELMHEAEKQGRQHHFLPLPRSAPAHVGAAPPITPYPTVGPRQQGAPNPTRRLPMLAPPRRQPLIPPPGHANRAPRIPPGAGPCWRRPADNPLSHRRATPTGRPESCPPPAPCWRRPAGKALIHRRTTPTGRPESSSAPAHVGATPPTTPYPTVGPRQQGASNPARCRPMLAPPRRQPLSPPSDHANRALRLPLAACPCWRRPADKALIHRRATPTGRPESRPAPAHVGAAPPAKP